MKSLDETSHSLVVQFSKDNTLWFHRSACLMRPENQSTITPYRLATVFLSRLRNESFRPDADSVAVFSESRFNNLSYSISFCKSFVFHAWDRPQAQRNRLTCTLSASQQLRISNLSYLLSRCNSYIFQPRYLYHIIQCFGARSK